MTSSVAHHVPDIHDYAQVVVDYDPKTGVPMQNPDDNEGWHALTVHIWSSIQALYTSFADPGYKASAGKHIFCRLDQKGCLAKVTGEEVSPALKPGSSSYVRSVIFHRKGTEGRKTETEVQGWLQGRFATGQKAVTMNAGVLRYRQWLDRTPTPIGPYFEGTQFNGGSWEEFCAVEEFVFTDSAEATRFLAENREWIRDGKKPLIIAGPAKKVLGTD